MKVFLLAITGLVPSEMVHCIHTFLDFCYFVQHDFHDNKSLKATQDALDQFRHYCRIFINKGIHDNFNLPQQHLLHHYIHLIQEYGSPDGICSSITENKHIQAVKEQSSKWEAMWQMLVTNQWINKLAVPCMHFKSRGMLKGSYLSDTLHRLHMSPNLPTWTALQTVNITGQKVHVDKGGSADDSDTNNSNSSDNSNNNGNNSNDNDGGDNNNNNNNVAISATNVLADVQLAKTIGMCCISSHVHLLI